MSSLKVTIVRALPILVFVILLVSTIVAWRVTQDVVRAESRKNFTYEAEIAKHWIHDRLNLYLPIFLGVGSFLETVNAVTPTDWATYIRGLKLIDKYPGISSIHYIERVKDKDREAFVKELKADKSLGTEYVGFTIHPENKRDEYYIIKYVEPLKDHAPDLGFDLSSNEKELGFLNHIRDESPTSQGQVTLITTRKKGFEIILPVYRKGFPVETAGERKDAFRGFIQVEFAGDKLFQDIFKRVDSANLDFEVYAGSPDEENLLYDQDPQYSAVNPGYKSEVSIKDSFEFNSQTWYLVATTKPAFKLSPAQERLPIIVLIIGLVFSFAFLGAFLFLKEYNKRTKGDKQQI